MASVAFWDSGVFGEEALSSIDNSVAGAAQRAAIINRTYAIHPWDTATIDGHQLPGICRVMDGMTKIGIDLKKPDGKDGSTITVKGYRPGPFELSVSVWTKTQWDALTTVLDAIWRRPQKKAKGKTHVSDIAVPIFHPALALYGISSCAIQGVTFPSDGPFDGAKTVKIKCLENVPPGPKKQTKTAASKTGLAPSFSAAQSIVDANGNEVVQSTVNSTPTPPSKNRKSLGPGGPAPTPANGST